MHARGQQVHEKTAIYEHTSAGVSSKINFCSHLAGEKTPLNLRVWTDIKYRGTMHRCYHQRYKQQGCGHGKSQCWHDSPWIHVHSKSGRQQHAATRSIGMYATCTEPVYPLRILRVHTEPEVITGGLRTTEFEYPSRGNISVDNSRCIYIHIDMHRKEAVQTKKCMHALNHIASRPPATLS